MIRPRWSAFFDGYLRRRFSWMFFGLLLAIGVGPVLKELSPRTNFMGPVLTIGILVAIASAPDYRKFRLLAVLGLAFGLAYTFWAVVGGEAPLLVGQFVWVFTCVLATAASMRQAFRSGSVGRERIFAALDAYLMAGLIFGVCYRALEQNWPASFGTPAASDLDLPGAVYFSFVTIATLGYGDIVPVSESARGLAILEAVGGQLYIAVLVARLVGLHTASEGDRAKT